MHYVFNKTITNKPSKLLWFLAISGWAILGLVIIAGYIMDNYGAKLW